MIRIRQGKVIKELSHRPGVDEVLVEVDGVQERAVNYHHLTGPVRVGDTVVLNTTAVHKRLGTGGNHFLMANLSTESHDCREAGHIMKLRYTPCQVKVLAVEEEDSEHSQVMRQASSLEKMPVVAATLHSMLPAVAAAIKSVDTKLRVAYVMTDGAALPISFSKLVKLLKDKNLIDSTITSGHAFGGDYEAVNIYSALLAAKAVAKADVAVVAMGPGIVGTGSKYGYTGLEQGQVVNAVYSLDGRALAVPRISFADPRPRHRGLSHHTVTALGKVALAPCTVTVPKLEKERAQLLQQQLQDSGILEKHRVVYLEASKGIDALKAAGIKVTTMGRTLEQDREFFLSAAAAGLKAAQMVHQQN
ncbi:DUF3866 family protein [Desulfofalx alkaliphila]|uniref:DUF3866 family protein n=1 Tax=Desulfofalx alkaliphila TaxID=105483 RepID=UPI0004E21BFE|nr:DUF3866 family protein [Desulfofalx alkaliphila]